MAWGFQRGSQLLPIFKYYLDHMQQTGVINGLYHKLIGDPIEDPRASTIQDLQALGYDNVILPFLALLTGIWASLLQLGIEAISNCMRKCSDDQEQEQSRQDDSRSEEAKGMINDINNLLLHNHRNLGGKKFLSKIRRLAVPDPRKGEGTKY